MREHRPQDAQRREIATKFDLTYAGDPTDVFGSDFLSDVRRFDVVVLHHIFGGWGDGGRPDISIAEHFSFSLSPLHAPESWRARLAASGAKRIFVFGGRHEVGPLYLAQMPGYAMIPTQIGAVFELSKPPRAIEHVA